MPATATVVDLRSVAPQPTVPTPEETNTETAAETAAIEGHIDAVQDGRVYGWAWDRAHPADRLEVEIRLERDGAPPLPLGRVLADRPRADLAANRIGDGSHAFEAEITLPPDAAPGRVSAVLRSPTTGGVEVFTQPSAEELRFDRLLAPHLERIADRIDAVRRDQRQVAAAQQAAGRLLRDLNEGIAATRAAAQASTAQAGTAQAGTAQAERQDAFAEGLRDMAERVGSLEVFLIRMDSTLRGFEGAIAGNAAKAGGRPMLAVIGGAAGAFLATLATLVGSAVFRSM